jgi:hypothetical protein
VSLLRLEVLLRQGEQDRRDLEEDLAWAASALPVPLAAAAFPPDHKAPVQLEDWLLIMVGVRPPARRGLPVRILAEEVPDQELPAATQEHRPDLAALVPHPAVRHLEGRLQVERVPEALLPEAQQAPGVLQEDPTLEEQLAVHRDQAADRSLLMCLHQLSLPRNSTLLSARETPLLQPLTVSTPRFPLAKESLRSPPLLAGGLSLKEPPKSISHALPAALAGSVRTLHPGVI